MKQWQQWVRDRIQIPKGPKYSRGTEFSSGKTKGKHSIRGRGQAKPQMWGETDMYIFQIRKEKCSQLWTNKYKHADKKYHFVGNIWSPNVLKKKQKT